MSIETMKQALEALDSLLYWDNGKYEYYEAKEAITALRAAIAKAEKQEPVAWMTINAYGEEDDICYENPEGHLPDGWTYLPLYTHPPKAKQPQEEPLGYWNAVQGWVELPEEEHKPTAWVYPEALEAFQQGQPWTAYGTDGNGPNTDGVERIPLYTTPPAAQRQPLTDEDWKQLWAEFDSSGIENDFQDHMVSKYGAGHYTDADMYWQFQQQVIKQMVNAMLKEKNT